MTAWSRTSRHQGFSTGGNALDCLLGRSRPSLRIAPHLPRCNHWDGDTATPNDFGDSPTISATLMTCRKNYRWDKIQRPLGCRGAKENAWKNAGPWLFFRVVKYHCAVSRAGMWTLTLSLDDDLLKELYDDAISTISDLTAAEIAAVNAIWFPLRFGARY
ncbi:hypothetical protein BC828DRAFT_380670 [Blastocladiella britannica]|nr:hypothetical protein BC828DRAFT_380670 [Blastocladiella britannica]